MYKDVGAEKAQPAAFATIPDSEGSKNLSLLARLRRHAFEDQPMVRSTSRDSGRLRQLKELNKGAIRMSRILTSESVTEGHPDKVSDLIADSILDACLEQDPSSRVACEVLCKNDLVVLAGEITSVANVDYEAVAREAVRSVGYVDPDDVFHADGLRFSTNITRQSNEIRECECFP